MEQIGYSFPYLTMQVSTVSLFNFDFYLHLVFINRFSYLSFNSCDNTEYTIVGIYKFNVSIYTCHYTTAFTWVF